MPTGAITSNIDVAQVVLYAFFVFFAGLVFYLRREDKREGYPLESDRSDKVIVQGFPAIPPPKVFRLANGETQTAPRDEGPAPEVAAKPMGAWPGAPLYPTGNPMLDGVGPAAYAMRAEKPEMTAEGHPKIVPLRKAGGFALSPRDTDPRGLEVLGGDNRVAGTVRDVWIDLAEPQIRYLEVEVAGDGAPRTALLPMGFVRIPRFRIRPHVKVESILAHHFADVPATKSEDQITMREEDRITAYYASGHLYAHPSRTEPIL
jgi:photosynthetic reaction center H subunit